MKKALFIGASSDIGIEVVKLLLKKKYYSYCTFYKNSQALRLLERKNPQKINLFRLNLSKMSEVKKFVNRLKKKTKKIDLIILGANMGIKRKKFELLNFRSFKNSICGNFLSNVFLIQFLVKLFIKQNNLKIIHISSLSSKKGSWGLSEYSSSKAALDNVLKCLDQEYNKLIIKLIYLGAVKTKGYTFTNKRKNKKNFITTLQAAKKILSSI